MSLPHSGLLHSRAVHLRPGIFQQTGLQARRPPQGRSAQIRRLDVCCALSETLYFAPLIASASTAVSQYVPEAQSPGWEIWFGAVAAAIPFAIGSWEFVKRILIQRRCQRCQGSGLVRKRRYRSSLDVQKCPDCGGFFPWQGWRQFLTSTAAPGNGGPLRQPKGQTSVFYSVPPLESKRKDGTSGVHPSSTEGASDAESVENNGAKQ